MNELSQVLVKDKFKANDDLLQLALLILLGFCFLVVKVELAVGLSSELSGDLLGGGLSPRDEHQIRYSLEMLFLLFLQTLELTRQSQLLSVGLHEAVVLEVDAFL